MSMRGILLSVAWSVPVIASAANAATISLNTVIRDFKGFNEAGGHIDFENFALGDDRGIVTGVLAGIGDARNPTYANNGGPSTHSAGAFNQWFTDTPGVNLNTNYALV